MLQVHGNHLELEGEAREAPPSALAHATRVNFLTHRGVVARPRVSAPQSAAVCAPLQQAVACTRASGGHGTLARAQAAPQIRRSFEDEQVG